MFKLNSSRKPVYSTVFWSLLVLLTCRLPTYAEHCGLTKEVYGENDVVDQILNCARGELLDLDLTPQGEYQKGTPKVLVLQGFSNKTTVIYAKLSGMWSAHRPSFVQSGWTCEANKTSVNSLVEFAGLSLEVVERVETPFHRNQHRIASHKPCKTFDLPLWMCRQSKPIYRSTKTWVNRAFFNLTLTQSEPNRKPEISDLSMIFTCPETFKQRITHSPSATYILSKFLNHPEGLDKISEGLSKFLAQPKKRSTDEESVDAGSSIAHPVMFATNQDGKSLASPPYHNSVNLIVSQVTSALRSSISECLQWIDMDLSLMADHNSFSETKFIDNSPSVGAHDRELLNKDGELVPLCSSKHWLKQRIELANQAKLINSQADADDSNQRGPEKRNSFMISYPADPNVLLNPYGYYHDNADQMVQGN